MKREDLSAEQGMADFKVVLVSPYELGRQPFALAHPAAWLKRQGFAVACIDLSLDKLEAQVLQQAGLIAVYVGMHTATRIAMEAIPRIRALAPRASLCVYGLYAPMNEALLRALGVESIFGGEFEPALTALAVRLRCGNSAPSTDEPLVSLRKIEFLVPDRSGLPPLSRYAHLRLPDGARKIAGFADASRGCKHWCRHCPVVPVYQGKFRVVPVETVMADIRSQVAAGAAHISFGDPDFLNGPTHAMKLVAALHHEFPAVTYDATIKIQHLVEHAELLAQLKDTGCLFIVSAVESVDDAVLKMLDKNHTRADFERAVALTRAAGIALAPTFVPFTPWTTIASYIALLTALLELKLVESVAPVQLSIRLLAPKGSWLLRIPGFRDLVQEFDPKILGYPWRHDDPRVDALQAAVQSWVEQAEGESLPRPKIFEKIWALAHDARGMAVPALAPNLPGAGIPSLSEPWYCCAEPTSQQLRSF